ncbi:hypothetical protein [Amycolatopsis sp. NPDC059021]|uniref:hypothetical protein n=1 Tax=Amycolatopsis sp. NPDC059021 TaxID=3346704 RepID=UPI003672BF63
MITHNATLNVAHELTPFRQAVLVLRWFRDTIPGHRLATDHKISIATAYRYLHEGITALATHAPDLQQILADRHTPGRHARDPGRHPHPHRPRHGHHHQNQRENRGQTVHLWYSGKHRAFGGNIPFLTTPDGSPPLWISDVVPGSRNDLGAARHLNSTDPLCATARHGLKPRPPRPATPRTPTTCTTPAYAPSANAPSPPSQHAGKPLPTTNTQPQSAIRDIAHLPGRRWRGCRAAALGVPNAPFGTFIVGNGAFATPERKLGDQRRSGLLFGHP